MNVTSVRETGGDDHRQGTAAPYGAHPVAPASPPLVKVVAGASIGTVIEYYDFGIYSSMAVQIGVHFFPPQDAKTGVILAVGSTGLAFLVRPLGGMLFGILSDTVGRKFTFMVTLILMSLATILMGVVPPYAAIGMAAPLIILGLRIVQGLAVGGEYAAASTYVVEHAPDARRGFYTGWLGAMTSVSLLLSLVAVSVTSRVFGPKAFNDYAWRIPFLFAAVMLVFALFVRSQLKESPIFLHLKAKMGVAKSPLRDVLTNKQALGDCMAVAFGICTPQITAGLTGSMFTLYSLQTLAHVDTGYATLVVAFGSLFGSLATVCFGALSDRLGRRRVQICGMLAGVVLFYPIYVMLVDAARAGRIDLWFWACAMQLPGAMIVGPGFAAMTEAFPARRRATSVALAFSVGGVIGGFSPGAALLLSSLTPSGMGGILWPIAVLALGGAIYWRWIPDRSGQRMWDDVLEGNK
ncbi:MFS transporter [Novosphingobium sp. SG707]|uniref:MFS transporter n=1 Tax=Novosphingobium sp. SG707 TaxID=2586996 RepID=UPI001445A603|nr:MFS transporter [Novosphingobium sp. SG707]NKI99274.1 MFS family permease [Novosphingobium sp. SG707]